MSEAQPTEGAAPAGSADPESTAMVIRSVEYAGTLVDPKAPYPGELPQVAFSGRSNVGKSSLINLLLRRTRNKIAHVSSTPGKTQALNFFRVNDRFFLVDLPGFGYAKVPHGVKDAWKPLVEGYLAREDGPLAVVHLVDIRRGPTPDDLKMLDYLAKVEIPTLVVLTKADKLKRQPRMKALASIRETLGVDEEQLVVTSAQTGEGRETILEALEALLAEAEAAKAGGEPGADAGETDAGAGEEGAGTGGPGAGTGEESAGP